MCDMIIVQMLHPQHDLAEHEASLALRQTMLRESGKNRIQITAGNEFSDQIVEESRERKKVGKGRKGNNKEAQSKGENISRAPMKRK